MNDLMGRQGLQRFMRIAAALMLVSVLLASNAQAAPVGVETLVVHTTVVSKQFSTLEKFDVGGPGVLKVRLENIAWPERLAALNCSIFSMNGFSHAMEDTSEFSVVLSGAGTFYAKLTALAQGALKLGLFSFKVTFEPSASPVPLPGAALLLASVLGFFGLRWHGWPALRFMLGRARFA